MIITETITYWVKLVRHAQWLPVSAAVSESWHPSDEQAAPASWSLFPESAEHTGVSLLPRSHVRMPSPGAVVMTSTSRTVMLQAAAARRNPSAYSHSERQGALGGAHLVHFSELPDSELIRHCLLTGHRASLGGSARSHFGGGCRRRGAAGLSCTGKLVGVLAIIPLHMQKNPPLPLYMCAHAL